MAGGFQIYFFRQYVNDMVLKLLLVSLGGAVGSVLRYGFSLVFPAKSIPWPTLLVNIIGSFTIGVIMALFLKNNLPGNWKLFLATGVCGGFTTFSAFSIENLFLLQQGKTGLAIFYIILSITAGIAAAFAGYKLLINN